MDGKKGISSFSVLLLMAVTAIAGIACFSQLKVQYTPSVGDRVISISYWYPGASARIVETEVTSKIEGALSGIRGCTDVRSVSMEGGGYVMLAAGKHADIDAMRFEIASRIRNLWTALPENCSYPEISKSASGGSGRTAIAFDVRSSLPSKDMARYINEYLIHPLGKIDGVSNVDFYGVTPFEWVITFDSEAVTTLGINANDIQSSINEYYTDEILGMTKSGNNTFGVKLRSEKKYSSNPDFSSIPVKNVNGRIIYLGEIASFSYQEAQPDSYFRINGLNTLLLTVGIGQDANLLSVVKNVKEEMIHLQKSLPKEISASVYYDYSEYVREELDKIYFRTALCLLILLLFVFIVNRSWRYMMVIALTLATNLFVSVAIYFLVGLHIHIYTLAGITVSLGIIIDNSIVMIDHWSRYRNRSVFPALLSAVLTTVAALLIVLLLPEKEKANLTDFTLVIVINLCVSLIVAYLFVPALLDYFPVEKAGGHTVSPRRLRRIACWDDRYERYINWGLRHRWVLVAAFLVMFGIPTFLLPDSLVRWKPYVDNRSRVDAIIGSSFALFNDALSRSDFYREPERQQLFISAGMPEGCSAQQLNEVLRYMENYLASIDEIEMYETSVSSSEEGQITVLFKPEYEGSWLPQKIKSDVISMASNFGGANWQISGIDDQYFNNQVLSDIRSSGITLTGYNYDDLITYGQKLIAHLAANRRVSEPEIWGGDYYDSRPSSEFSVSYDFAALAVLGISPYSYWQSLYSPLYSASVTFVPDGDSAWANVRLESSNKDKFDAWHVNNTSTSVGEGKMKLSEIGGIMKDRTGNTIRRSNQSYVINVKYNVIGSSQIADKITEEAINYMNGEVLPIGYRAENENYRWFYDNKDKYAGLILIVIAIIFAICTIYFNSLRYSFAIIWMIPIAFIGTFLSFGLSNFVFDKGGFAAFVMLSGITVNAGIYLLAAWQGWKYPGGSYSGSKETVHQYVRSFNRKIWPVSLTILSTVLGLVPFLFDGPGEVFWFCLSIGTISGLVFSAVAFILYLPVFSIRRKKNRLS